MKLLVIGLDGATFDQLTPWIEAGYMPTLGRLIRDGAWARLRSTIPPITAPAWSSFATGLNPGRHGIFGFLRPIEGKTRERALNNSRDIRGLRFWTVLNYVGSRVGVVDLPMFFPPEEIAGFMVSDVITSGWKRALTYPEGLKVELELTLPNVARMLKRPLLDGVIATGAYLDKIIRSLECKEVLDLHLMETQDWDVFVTIYPHTDVFQHYFWHVIDTAHPWYDPKVASKLMPQIEQLVRRLDVMISRLVGSLDEGIVILMSDHGFGPVKRVVYVNTLLRLLGYLRVKSEGRRASSLTAGVIKKWGTKLDIFRLRRLIRKGLRLQMREILRKALLPDIDWAKTQAYFEMNNDQGVWINRRTKLNPDGLEMAEGAYEELRDQLIADLRQAKDPETEELLFEAVYRREEVFIGPFLECAPDIVFQPAYGYVTSSDLSTEIVRNQPRGLVSGYHRPKGILIVWGPNIRSGELVEARIEDVAPTLLYLAGAPVPEGLDGHVLDVVMPAYRASHPVTYFDASTLMQEIRTDREIYSDQDKEVIIERLRSLGYM